MPDSWNTFAKRVKGRRKALELNQEQLAEASTMSQSDISKIERGDMQTTTKMAHLARALKCDSYWLATGEGPAPGDVVSEPSPARVDKIDFVPVVGRGEDGELPASLWTDDYFPVGATNEYAEVTSTDPLAFVVQVVGPSMIPKYTPGDYALVEPGTEPDIEDDVLVRLANGKTMIKRLLSRRGHIRLGSYNDPEILVYEKTAAVWLYYVAYPVPARKIKNRS